jgi:tRNA (guanine-N7-)-methyltransferase
MSLPSGLSAYEFQRLLSPSRDLSHYYHLRLLKDERGLPLLTPDGAAQASPVNVAEFFALPKETPVPIEIEVGCGKGTFMTAYCEKHPDLPFLALEKEAEIAYEAAGRIARRGQLGHVRVVLGDAFIFFRDFLPESCAQAFHIYFPDPWPKKRHHKHRIMREDFLEQVRRVATPEALFYFGTDHAEYHAETRELFSQTPWLEMLDPDAQPTEGIQTNFEIKYRRMGKPIYRCVLRVHK